MITIFHKNGIQISIFSLRLFFWLSISVLLQKDTIIITIIIIIIIIDYYTQSIVVSCSSWFCESGQQSVVKGLTESCTMILIYFFLGIQVPVSKSLLSPTKLYFVHVLLSSQSQLLQYTSQSQLILHLMHLQLLGLKSLLSCPTFLQSHL